MSNSLPAELEARLAGIDTLINETIILNQRACFVAGARWRETTSNISGDGVVMSEAVSRYQVRTDFSLTENYDLRAEVSRLQAENEAWTEKESSVCPEDWGFVEYIKHLESRLAQLKENALTPEQAGWLMACIRASDAKAVWPEVYETLRSISAGEPR